MLVPCVPGSYKPIFSYGTEEREKISSWSVLPRAVGRLFSLTVTKLHSFENNILLVLSRSANEAGFCMEFHYFLSEVAGVDALEIICSIAKQS